jgi:cation diffusion facilitator CzcD-associated flavoprotein CzcO
VSAPVPDPSPRAGNRRELGAIVVGGGISGIAAVVRLRRDAGIEDVVLIEKSRALGGTWNDNEYPVDTIIWATGFHTSDPAFLSRIFGRDGRSLAEDFGDNPKAYMGTSPAGFPNAFMMWGPNSGTGCNFVMVEAQLNYTIAALRTMRETGATSLDVRPEVVETWKTEMRSAMAGSTWVKGRCKSWYQDPTGDIHAIYGGTMRSYLARSHRAPAELFHSTQSSNTGTADAPEVRAVS